MVFQTNNSHPSKINICNEFNGKKDNVYKKTDRQDNILLDNNNSLFCLHSQNLSFLFTFNMLKYVNSCHMNFKILHYLQYVYLKKIMEPSKSFMQRWKVKEI